MKEQSNSLTMERKRFDELGLGCNTQECKECEFCVKKSDNIHYCRNDSSMSIEEYEQSNFIASCIDMERIKMESTEEEYDAIRHNRLIVK